MLKELIDHGSTINTKNQIGLTPIMISSKKSRTEMVKELLNGKASVNEVDLKKNTALHYACINSKIDEELIKILVENKAKINASNYNCSTPIHNVCNNKMTNIKILSFLVNNKADLNISNSIDCRPLHNAISNHFDMKVLSFLVDHSSLFYHFKGDSFMEYCLIFEKPLLYLSLILNGVKARQRDKLK